MYKQKKLMGITCSFFVILMTCVDLLKINITLHLTKQLKLYLSFSNDLTRYLPVFVLVIDTIFVFVVFVHVVFFEFFSASQSQQKPINMKK